ncbi:MAG: thioredoxin family protein [Deltaproteobacteria bacterium]|nr:thioredoxin family protein [Deltaproteobacteria bacterium]
MGLCRFLGLHPTGVIPAKAGIQCSYNFKAILEISIGNFGLILHSYAACFIIRQATDINAEKHRNTLNEKGDEMPLLSEQDAEFLKKDFESKLKNNVKIIFFKSEDACLYCKEVKDILLEVSGLSDKISLEEYDFDQDKEKVKRYSIKRTPGIVIEGEKDYGVRFYGIPAGHEFMTLIHGIMNVSAKNTGLSEKTIEKLKEIIKPYNIQVFVTPT